MSEETWVCDTCQHQIPKTSVFGFVGWMSDIARHVRECANQAEQIEIALGVNRAP